MISTESHGAVTVLSAGGALVGEAAEGLVDVADEHAGRGLPQVVFDLSQAPLIDSIGLDAVLGLREAIRGKGGVIKLAGPRPLVEDILTATGVGDHFEVFPNTKVAVGSFSR